MAAILLSSLDSRVRGNDKFFQYIFSLAVIPAKLVLDLIGERGSGFLGYFSFGDNHLVEFQLFRVFSSRATGFQDKWA